MAQQLVKQFSISNRSHRFSDQGSQQGIGFGIQKAKIVPIYRTFIGEFSPPQFLDSILAYRSDTDTYGAINFQSSAALESGFFITGDEEYEGGDAIKAIEDFNKNVRWGNQYEEHGLLPMLRTVLPEELYSGNLYVEMQDQDNLQRLNQIQISTIWKTVRNEDGSVKEIWQKVGGIPNQLDPDTIIHVPFRTINREAYGSGMLESLIRPRLSATGEVIPPWYIIKASLEYDMWRIIHRRGSPRSLWNFPGAGDEEIDRYMEQLADPAVDETIVYNLEGASIDSEKGGPMQGVFQLIDEMLKRYQAGLQTPFNNLLNSSGYTEASARVAKEIGGVPISDIQTRLAQFITEELWRRVLMQAGFDPEKADIQLHWGVEQEPDYTLQDVANMFDRAALTPSELRKMLRDQGWPLDDDSIFETWATDERALKQATIGGKGFGVALPPNQASQPDQDLTMLNPANLQTQAQTQGLTPGQSAKVDPTAAPPAGAPSAAPAAKAPPAQKAPAPAPAKDSLDDDMLPLFTVENGTLDKVKTVKDARYMRTHKFQELLSTKDKFVSKNKMRPVISQVEEKGKDPLWDAQRGRVRSAS